MKSYSLTHTGLRSFTVKRYTIFYVPVADGVEIRRVTRPSLNLEDLDLD